jgi:hypothetical protein
MNRIILATLGTVIGCASAEAAESTADNATSDKIVTITYKNMTAGQVFSPAVFFSHNASAPPLFTEGQPAPFALQRIAEEGNTGPLLSGKITKVLGGAYKHATNPISVQPGKSRTIALRVSPEHPLITGAFMLVMTNDGFSGIRSVDAYALEEPMTVELYAWDAGTENNNERGNFLIAMEGTERDPENAVVHRHEGLRGDADAPGFWKFDPARPVGLLTIAPSGK